MKIRRELMPTCGLAAAATLLIALAGGCGAPAAQEPAPAELRLAVGKGPEVIPLIAAAEAGFFAAEGITVELVPADHWREMEIALQAGAVDGALGSIYSPIRLQERGFLVMAASTSGTGYILAVSPSRGDTFTALMGAVIALSDDITEQYLLETILAENGLSPADLSLLVHESPDLALEALRQGRADAVFIPRRLGEEALQDGAICLAADPGDRFSGAVIMFGGEALQEKTAILASFYRAFHAAVLALNEGHITWRALPDGQWNFPEKWLEEERPLFAAPRPLVKEEVDDFLSWLRRRDPDAFLPVYEALVWREKNGALFSE